MADRRRKQLLMFILLGLILGGICGIIFAQMPQDHSARVLAIKIADPLGILFVNLLKMIVTPVVIFTLINGVASISPSKLGNVGVKIVAYYMITSVFAIVIGLLVGYLMNPGTDLTLAGDAAAVAKKEAPSLISIFLGIVPTNPFAAIVKNDVLAIIFFSVVFGLALSFIKESKDNLIRSSGEVVDKFFEGCTHIIILVVGWVMLYAPIGVFALIFKVFAENGADAFGSLLHITATVYLGLAIQILVVYAALVAFSGLSPLLFFKKAFRAWLTAFVTRSSGATLPISTSVAEHQMGISKGVYGFTLPLGATINMDGTTIYLGVCAIFIANAVGIPLGFDQKIAVILTAVLASIGAAGVPGAGAIMLIMVLESAGLDLTNPQVALAYAMILGIDALLDMGRTSANIVGDLCGTAIVAKNTDSMDMSKWQS